MTERSSRMLQRSRRWPQRPGFAFGAALASPRGFRNGVTGGGEVVGEAARVGFGQARWQRLAQFLAEGALQFRRSGSSSALCPALLWSSRRPLRRAVVIELAFLPARERFDPLVGQLEYVASFACGVRSATTCSGASAAYGSIANSVTISSVACRT